MEVRVALDTVDERAERLRVRAVRLPFRLELGEALPADLVLVLEAVDQRRGVRAPRPQAREQELRDFLARYSPWSLVETPDEHAVDGLRRELHRAYEFPSYQAAFYFMSEVSERAIERQSHHPRWQNTWTQVEVWLTTYNLGCLPSIKDLKLAESCEQVWREIRRSHVW